MTQSEETEEVVSFETNSTESAAKKQKTEKAPPTEGEEKTLKRPDLAKIKELYDTVSDLVKKYEEAVSDATAPEMKEYLPQKYLLKLTEKKTDLLSRTADIELACQSGKSKFTPSALKKMCNDIKKETKEEITDVKGRIATAQVDMQD